MAGDAATRYWNRLATAWLARARPQRLWRAHSDAVNRRLLERWLPRPDGPDGVPAAGRVLKTDLFEEAVGAGQASLLAARFGSVAGMDLAWAVGAAARRCRPDLYVAVADARRLPYADGAFDAVVSLSTLDHLDSTEALLGALTELARVLRPGGRLVLTLDNPANPLLALRQALPFPLLHRLGLVPYFCGPSLGPRPLRAALDAVGFEVREVTAVLHCPRVLAVPAAALLDRAASPRVGRVFLRILAAFERLGRLPTRYLTGHFVAAWCVRRPDAPRG